MVWTSFSFVGVVFLQGCFSRLFRHSLSGSFHWDILRAFFRFIKLFDHAPAGQADHKTTLWKALPKGAAGSAAWELHPPLHLQPRAPHPDLAPKMATDCMALPSKFWQVQWRHFPRGGWLWPDWCSACAAEDPFGCMRPSSQEHFYHHRFHLPQGHPSAVSYVELSKLTFSFHSFGVTKFSCFWGCWLKKKLGKFLL